MTPPEDLVARLRPRLLEVMGPPHFVEDIYEAHTFETLLFHRFHDWPERERSAVLDWLRFVETRRPFFDDDAREEWRDGMTKLDSPAPPPA